MQCASMAVVHGPNGEACTCHADLQMLMLTQHHETVEYFLEACQSGPPSLLDEFLCYHANLTEPH